MAVVLAAPLSQQLQPRFIEFRSLYTARERPSRLYSWVVLVFSSIVVEIPWNLFAGSGQSIFSCIPRLTLADRFFPCSSANSILLLLVLHCWVPCSVESSWIRVPDVHALRALFRLLCIVRGRHVAERDGSLDSILHLLLLCHHLQWR